MDFWGQLLDSSGFMPHGYCYFWQSDVLWSMVIGDAMTAAAYFAIPVALAIFAKKRPELKFRGVLFLFASFILACGATHVIDVFTIWHPTYRLSSVIKVLTGLVSIATAIHLWRLLPVAVRVPSLREWDNTNDQLVESNRQLSIKVAELEKAKGELENFSYTISHNLRAPVRHIIAFSETLSEGLSPELLSDSQRYDLAAIRQSSKHMGHLIDDLLDYMRTGQLSSQLESVNLNDMVDQICNMLDEKSSQSCVWDIGDLPTIQADKLLMFQLWQNLLENAVKFSSKNPNPFIRLRAKELGNAWEFTLEDNGVGFSEAGKEKMFDIFQRLHKQSEFPGTGIGLAQAKQIVERHLGTIDAFGDPGKGSRFVLRFPMMLQEMA